MADQLITTQNDRDNDPQTSFYSTRDRSKENQYEQEAKTSADQAKIYRDQAESAKNSAESAQASAEDAEEASRVNADIAQQAEASANAAESSELNAEAARDKAKQWAELPENSEVDAGQFSALHHATKASASAVAADSSEQAAAASETAAAQSAVNASASEQGAAASEQNASLSEGKAQQWAEGSGEVEPGAYSAKYWADQAEQITSGARVYQGGWDASGGTAPIASPATGDEGKFWVITANGTINGTAYVVGDELAINNDLIYERIPSPYAVQEVNGESGSVTITPQNIGAFAIDNDLSEGSPVEMRGNLGLGSAAVLNAGNLEGEVVARGASGVIPGSITGNAETATALESARVISLSGDVSVPQVSFDGTENVDIPVTVEDDSHLHTLSTISDAGSAASRNVGSASADLSDNASFAEATGASRIGFSGSANGLSATEAQGAMDELIFSLRGLFLKADGGSPAWMSTGQTSLGVATNFTASVQLKLVKVEASAPIEMPVLSPGSDYYIYLAPDGSLQAADADSTPPSGERLVGGFHCAAGSGSIEERSLWDLNWRPRSNPRGMTLSRDGKVWADIYLMDTQYGVNGYSRNGVTIADDGNRPVIPGIYGGNGSNVYGSMSWWVAVDLATAAGKRLPFYQEFTALAYGVVERQAVGTDPVTTQHQAGHRSACGCEQITGVMYQWGADINGTSATGAASWQDIAEGRGDVYTNSIRSPLFGAPWVHGSNAGSRASDWSGAPDDSYSAVSARGVSDHLNLQAER